ncbi:Uncharacterised protein [Mycobacteroides abscessus]|nr:Uncharacterised protein [Mycobacteroides abscessus]
MKNRPESGSPNCCDSVMLPPRRARAPATACTIPGPSGHESVRTQCVGSSVGGCAAGASVARGATPGSVVDTPQRVVAHPDGCGRRPARGRGRPTSPGTPRYRARMSDTMSP